MWAMMQKLRMFFIGDSSAAKIRLKGFVLPDVPLLISYGAPMYYIYKLLESKIVENATFLVIYEF